MTIKLETKIGERVLDDMHQLNVLMAQFKKEFTKKDYDAFVKKYSSYRPKERVGSWEYYQFKKNHPDLHYAPMLLNIPALLERNLIKIVRTEFIGRGKRNYYEVNVQYFDNLILDIKNIQDVLLYDNDDKCVNEGAKIVNFLSKRN